MLFTDYENSTNERISEEKIKWLIENQMTILNDGSNTRFNRSATKKGSKTGGLSSPDVSLCGEFNILV